ncbi:MAG: chromate transporter [Clostridium sp.]|uniref:chromate transporter n=1 Tax=Clostridium sp. TaxID=1506 RepID=UPI003EE5023B
MKDLIDIFRSFFKIGAFTFGGGYAMIPLIEDEVVNKKEWIDKEEFLDILTVSQSLPGAISVNCSLFVGNSLYGFKGSIAALLGVALPSFLIILVVASLFMTIRNNTYVNAAFEGINAGVPILVLAGVLSISKGVKKNKKNIVIFIIALILLVLNVNPIIVLIIFAIYGGIINKKRG